MHGTYLQNKQSILKYLANNPQKRRVYNKKYADFKKIQKIFFNILLE